MNKHCTLIMLFILSVSLPAQELVILGEQASQIRFMLKQHITVPENISEISVSFVEPSDFDSPTFSQNVHRLDFSFKPHPDREEKQTDESGNLIRQFSWENPGRDIEAGISLDAAIQVTLDSIRSMALFPLPAVSSDLKPFVEATSQVQSDDSEITDLANRLTVGSRTQLEAVRSVLHYVVENLRYTLSPDRFDAVTALHTGSGNCQNFSHLSAALLRASGIPVRIVNGVTFKKDYTIPVGESEYSFEMADGRHSWIEVYFPDKGWIPFDPQQSEYFVSSRYLRIEVGRDNAFTIQDGLVKWVRYGRTQGASPALSENISSEFLSDKVMLRTERKIQGLKRLLLTPPVQIEQEKTPLLAADDFPERQPEKSTDSDTSERVLPEVDFTGLQYDLPFESGNMEFPRHYDFLASRLADTASGSQSGRITRDFIVETAEYVTGRSAFAQLFVLDKPVLLETVSAALHSFGGQGVVWLELSEDAEGKPAPQGIASAKVPTPRAMSGHSSSNIRNRIWPDRGYDWVDFDFRKEGLLLSPGKYWIVLRYSGSPIINWFYIYGKPVGPVDGTRSASSPDMKWDKVLSYEFNYRVVGKTASDF